MAARDEVAAARHDTPPAARRAPRELLLTSDPVAPQIIDGRTKAAKPRRQQPFRRRRAQHRQRQIARQGYRLVSGSDYDWGQGIPELARWQRQHHTSLTLLYYGTDPLADGPRFQRLGVDRFPRRVQSHHRA